MAGIQQHATKGKVSSLIDPQESLVHTCRQRKLPQIYTYMYMLNILQILVCMSILESGTVVTVGLLPLPYFRNTSSCLIAEQRFIPKSKNIPRNIILAFRSQTI